MGLFVLCSYFNEKQGSRLSSDINMFPLCFPPPVSADRRTEGLLSLLP